MLLVRRGHGLLDLVAGGAQGEARFQGPLGLASDRGLPPAIAQASWRRLDRLAACALHRSRVSFELPADGLPESIGRLWASMARMRDGLLHPFIVLTQRLRGRW